MKNSKLLLLIIFPFFLLTCEDNKTNVSKSDVNPDVENFERNKQQVKENSFPEELVGTWRIGNRLYEFRSNGNYYVCDNSPCQLIDSGMTLVLNNNIRYKRIYGDTNLIQGVWFLESDLTEEWYFRSDGTYIISFPEDIYHGEFNFDGSSINTCELRSLCVVTGDTIIFDPPYGLQYVAKWEVTEPSLKLTFPSKEVIYTRE